MSSSICFYRCNLCVSTATRSICFLQVQYLCCSICFDRCHQHVFLLLQAQYVSTGAISMCFYCYKLNMFLQMRSLCVSTDTSSICFYRCDLYVFLLLQAQYVSTGTINMYYLCYNLNMFLQMRSLCFYCYKLNMFLQVQSTCVSTASSSICFLQVQYIYMCFYCYKLNMFR